MGVGFGVVADLGLGVISAIGVSVVVGVSVGVGVSVASTFSASTWGSSLDLMPKLKKLAPTITPAIKGITTLNIPRSYHT